MRWRHGDTNPVAAAVDSTTVIEIGDLLYLDTDDAKPASMLHLAWKTAEGESIKYTAKNLQIEFAAKFLGVAMQQSRPGDTDSVRVATTGVFEFDCPAGTFELGDYVSPMDDPSGDEVVLDDQMVTPVSLSGQAIARVAKRVPVAATSVKIDVRSTVMTGGIYSSLRSKTCSL
jgi:hypothetical protein